MTRQPHNNSRILSGFRVFAKSRDGAISVMNIFFLVTIAILGGVAIDMANLISARTQLQVAADVAAHAAILEREKSDVTVSKDKALALALQNMPESRYGNVLRAENIHFGTYDRDTKTFNIDETSKDAVFVETDRLAENANPVTSFLLQFVGYWNWDVVTTSVFETYHPTCLREGFVAEGVVDIQSNNSYFNGFCIHSNSHVALNNNNFFEAGTVVSMPDLNDLVIPTGGLDDDKNEGLSRALHEGKWRVRILSRLTDIKDGIQVQTSKYFREYITSDIPIPMSGARGGKADFTKGRIHLLNCNKYSFDGDVYEGIVIIANCALTFKNGTQFIDSTIITTNKTSKSMVAPNNLILGKKDDCAPGGGAQMITWGGFEVASSLEMHGSQIIAAGDIQFAANSNGIQGASMVAGGMIDGTSNMNFSFCGTGMETSFHAEYFRLAG